MNESNQCVSVVVSTYKRNEQLTLCLEAILRNDFVKEIIVIHDGPSSNFDLYKSNYPKLDRVNIKFISTDKWYGYPAPARNLGISESRGDFIAFCDDDDIWSNSHLSLCINKFKAFDNADIIFMNPSNVRSISPVSLNNIFAVNFLWQSCCVVKLTEKIRNDFHYNQNHTHKAIEDYMLWIKLIMKGFRIYYFNSDSIKYGLSEDSIRTGAILTNLKIIRALWIEYGAYGILLSLKWILYRGKYIVSSL